MRESIGKKLKRARLHRGLSQERLARLLDCSTRQVLRWENNYAKPSELQMRKIEDFIKKELKI